MINAIPEIRRVLVICPAFLRLNWRRELERWLVRPFRIHVVQGDDWRSTAEIVVVNYDVLSRHGDALRAQEWDLLIVDEAHALKNPKALRTQQVLGKWDRDPAKALAPIPAKRRLFLTGTPILNRPIELWPLLRQLDPDGLGRSWQRFVDRYCGGARPSRFGVDVSGASNLEELQIRLREQCMVRRRKADVLTELPPKRRQVLAIPPNGAAAKVAAENEVWARHEEAMEDAKAAVELAKASEDPAVYAAAVERLRQAARVAFTEIARVRHETALAKVPHVVEHVRECLEDGRKLVVFSHHKDVLDGIREGAGDVVSVRATGDDSQEDRQAAVDRFQTDPSCRVFFGTIAACGMGITLTAAAHVVFAELDWVPAMVTQAEDRLHRIGQDEPVLVQHIVLDGSLDARMAKVLVAKQAMADRALDVEVAQEVALPSEAQAPRSVGRARVDGLAARMTAEIAVQVHHCLRILARMCDGAQALDGHGFSKIDVRVGHSLAEAGSLTARQAALGLTLCRKYRRQLGDAVPVLPDSDGDVDE